MKTLFYTAMAAFALLAAPSAPAWSYQDGDALLIFRENGFDDVEFDLGSVTQFLNHPAGYTSTVSGWDRSLVTGVFGPDLTGVSVIVASTTAQTNAIRNAWLSANASVSSVSDVLASSWQADLWSTIDSIGTRPTNYATTVTEANAYDIDPSGTQRLTAYDYIVTGGGVNANSISELGGHAAFDVEGIAPSSFGFWQIQPTNAVPKPSASYIGTFTITTAGTLTFQAGSLQPSPPTIQGITRTGSVSAVSFNTTGSGNYWLVYTNALGSAISTWPVVSGPVTGNGGVQTLSHTNSANTTGFYGILRSP